MEDKITIAIGSDHGGYKAKEKLKEKLKEDYNIIDCGTDSADSCDYPIYAYKVSKMVADKKADKGVLICSSGEGVCIVANKVKGIIAGIGYNDEVSKLMVEHNHANIITFGAKFISDEEIERRTLLFLSAKPLEDRHQRRVALIHQIEEGSI